MYRGPIHASITDFPITTRETEMGNMTNAQARFPAMNIFRNRSWSPMAWNWLDMGVKI
jgi:hypothetical protein